MNFQKRYENHIEIEILRDIKLITTELRRNYLVSEANHHTEKKIWDDVFSKRNIKKNNNTNIMNKPDYLGLSILELIKIVMYKFWYDYMKKIYIKLYYMHIDSFTDCIRTEDSYVDIPKNVETRILILPIVS